MSEEVRSACFFVISHPDSCRDADANSYANACGNKRPNTCYPMKIPRDKRRVKCQDRCLVTAFSQTS